MGPMCRSTGGALFVSVHSRTPGPCTLSNPELVATGLKAHAIGSETGAVDASLDHSCGAIVLSST